MNLLYRILVICVSSPSLAMDMGMLKKPYISIPLQCALGYVVGMSSLLIHEYGHALPAQFFIPGSVKRVLVGNVTSDDAEAVAKSEARSLVPIIKWWGIPKAGITVIAHDAGGWRGALGDAGGPVAGHLFYLATLCALKKYGPEFAREGLILRAIIWRGMIYNILQLFTHAYIQGHKTDGYRVQKGLVINKKLYNTLVAVGAVSALVHAYKTFW